MGPGFPLSAPRHERAQSQPARLPTYRLPAEDRLPDEGRPPAEGAGDRGAVEHGDKRGRELGYPTANLPLGAYLRPRSGVYAVTGKLPGGRVVQGAANLGVRPQFDPPRELLEPYFLDFSGDLYRQEIEVAFHHFLRAEAKFDSLDELKAQMEADCARARRLLAE